ncbi:SDR family oxidoreductase [Aureimonas fodinaquatilis]|nr:SDR family oxidoreductase [Aureimonas fodinaquatilis]
MSYFSNRRVLVTGAAKGIGRATVKALVEEGAQVVAVVRASDQAQEVSSHFGCEVHIAELSDVAALEELMRNVTPLDDLVNCAGTTTLESVLDFQPRTFDDIMAVNLRAPLVLARLFAQGLVERQAVGAIVNVSSLAANVGIRDHAIYCASKAGLDAATRVMALEFGALGIRVNSVNPVVTLTPMAVKAWSDPAKSEPMLARIPAGRFVEPHEVADAILWLLGNRALMVNGISMPLDGGFTAV